MRPLASVFPSLSTSCHTRDESGPVLSLNTVVPRYSNCWLPSCSPGSILNHSNITNPIGSQIPEQLYYFMRTLDENIPVLFTLPVDSQCELVSSNALNPSENGLEGLYLVCPVNSLFPGWKDTLNKISVRMNPCTTPVRIFHMHLAV